MFTNKNSRSGSWHLIAVIGLLGSLILTIGTKEFLTQANLQNVIAQVVPLMITAIGQMIVILIGGLDLSVGAVISLSTSILVMDISPWMAIFLVLVASSFIGLVNGIGIAILNVHPIIMTLSSMSIVQGIALLIRPVAGGNTPPLIETIVNEKLFGIDMPLIWVVLVILIATKIIHASRYGLRLFAIGGHAENAKYFGIKVKQVQVSSYVLCSLFAAFAGLFLAGRIASGDPNIGTPFAIDSITAVALGGTQLSGGVGNLVGTVIGSLILAMLSNGMNLFHISAFLQTMIKGFILLFIIFFQSRKDIGL